MRISYIFIGVLQIWFALKLSYNEAIVFKFTNAVCESFNKSWVAIKECRLRAINREKTVFNFNATLLHPANIITLQAQLFKRESGYKPWLYKATIDICRFLRKPYNPFIIIGFKLVKEFTNFNQTCPLVGPHIIDGFYVRSALLPNILLTGDYQLALTWLFDKKPQFSTNLYFNFKEDL